MIEVGNQSSLCKHAVCIVLVVLCAGGCVDRPVEDDASLTSRTPTQEHSEPGKVQLVANRNSTNAGQWSRFRGPTGMGISESSGLPLTWNADENIAWKTPLPGPGASSPIVFGDHVYLTCYTGYFIPGDSSGSLEDLNRHLIAIDRNDGSILWNQSIPAKLPEQEKIRDHGYAASTPVADADHVYVFFGKSGVFAFDHNGNQKWHADVGERTHGWGSGTSPVIWNDLLLVNASVESQSLVALNRLSGEQVWTTGGIKEAWNTPLVVKSESGREELIVPTQGTVYAIDPRSGDKIWSCKTDIGWYMVPSPIAHDGVVYCYGGRSGVASLAIRTGGSGDVTSTHRIWTSLKGSNVSSPVYRDGHLYWMHEQRGIAYCALAESGDVIYEQRLDRAGQVYASAVLAGDRVYYLTRSGRSFVVAAKPEFEQLAVNELRDGGVFNASPVVDNGRLLIRSDKYLYCIAEK